MNKLSDSTNLLISWILVTILAPIAGAGVASLSLGYIGGGWLHPLTVGIGFLVWGFALGVGQWAILRTRLKKVWLWILFTGIGFPGGLFLGVLASVVARRSDDLISSLILGTTLGAILGVFQWLVLSKKVKNSIWWIPISTLTWGIDLTFMMECPSLEFMEYPSLELERLIWDPILEFGIAMGVFWGIPVGVLSGIAIAFLLRRTNIIQTITPQGKTSQDVLPS